MAKQFSKREQIIFFICIGLTVIYTGHHLLLKPLRSKITKVEKQIEVQEKKLKKHTASIGDAVGIEKEYATYLQHFKQAKSNEQIMSSLLSEIEDTAGELTLRISDLKPKPVKTEANFNRFSVSMTLESNFVDIVHFIYKLQDSPHLFAVDEVRFDKGSRAEAAQVKTQMVLSKTLIP